MKNELEFLEQLRSLQSKAEENYRCLSQADLDQFLQENGLGEEQTDVVLAYLEAQGIRITDEVQAEMSLEEKIEQAKLTTAEKRYIKEYQTDMSYIKEEKEGEKEEMFASVQSGDSSAKKRLIELYMPVVVDIALKLHTPEVYLGDLVQEGNVSLMLALEMLPAGNEDVFLKNEIRNGMKEFLEEHTEIKKKDNILAERVNDLDQAIQALKEEYGREIAIDELAEHMQISEEEIEDLIKIAGDELKNTDEQE